MTRWTRSKTFMTIANGEPFTHITAVYADVHFILYSQELTQCPWYRREYNPFVKHVVFHHNTSTTESLPVPSMHPTTGRADLSVGNSERDSSTLQH
ncbi:hypothetical protein K443DRAFT_611734 [Laccaria amethystina LaAM-08-1]|uniref:Uncharacterized protein n=1 Tax=Laccaria amethystina LaAM-08-1 TaxID=1095629 RepID=A0A0C9XWY6_9AGAR|nr:hypothetical protein K443DRAFT_611734 [Laccaria amethystina LaAM-08-1]